MVFYRRDFTPGGTYFFTVALENRNSSCLIQNINFLSNAFKQTRSQAFYKTHAIVVLPDHLHVIWELPPHDSNYSLRWRLVKTYFSRSLIKSGFPISKNKRNEYALWQRRFWEHRIRDEHDYELHVNYIHYNPVKHKLVKHVSDWPYSSIHRYIKLGILPEDWAGELGSYQSFGEE